MKDLIEGLILVIVMIFTIVMIETHTGQPNGGPGAMTTSDAVIGIGMKISSEY